MSNADKTKSQLLDEIRVLRKAIAAREHSVSCDCNSSHSLHIFADLLTDTVVEMKCSCDEETWNISYVNKAVSDVFGYSPSDITGESPRILYAVSTDFDDSFHSIQNAIKESHSQLTLECQFSRKDGETFPASVIMCFIYEENKCVSACFLVKDMSEEVSAERSLRLKDARLESILSAAPIGILVVEKNIISDVNDGFCAITGYSRAELYGMNPRSLFRSDDDYNLVRCFNNCDCLSKGNHSIETRIRHKSGRMFSVLVHCASLYPEKPGEGVTITMLDVTEKKHYERRLKASEDRYRDLFETMTNCVAVYEAVDDGDNFIFKDFNRSAENLERVKREDLLGRKVTDVFPGIKEFGLFKQLQYVWRSGKAVNHGPSFYRDGSRVGWRENHIYKLPTGELVVVYQDITDRKLAEEERDWFFNMSIDMLSIVELKGRFRQVNPAWINVLGWSHDELMGRSPIEFVHPDDRKDVRNVYGMLWSGKKVLQHESRFLCKDGSVRWISCNMFPLPEEGLAFNVGRDITERKRLESKLNQAQKMEAIGTLAGGIAHDFNNILGVIIGYADMSVESDLPKDSPVRDYIEQIECAGQRAKELIKQILTFSRKTEAQKQHLQLDVMIKESLKLLRATIPSTIGISQNIQAGGCSVNADPSQIHRLIINLCTNAAHAMRDSGGVLTVELVTVKLKEQKSLKITLLEPGRYVLLSVSDTGAGIPPELMNRIFEPYFTTKPQEEGTGMGLAVVHGVVNAHGGGLDVRSKLGEGTRFDVYFPYEADVFRKESAIENVDSDSVANAHILFVDDEKVVVEMTRSMLERIGYSVYATSDSLDALKYFRNNADNVDLLISDQTMPVMTGLDLAKEVLRIKPDLSILLCTGYSDQVTPERLARIGISKLLMKPFSMRDLGEIVKNLLLSDNS